ncbi:hypothetical protein J6590_107870, partial [Homalodisca vitripennis]
GAVTWRAPRPSTRHYSDVMIYSPHTRHVRTRLLLAKWALFASTLERCGRFTSSSSIVSLFFTTGLLLKAGHRNLFN